MTIIEPKNTQNKQNTFSTDNMRWSEVETKSGKNFFVEGYCSTGQADLVDDIVSNEGLDDIFTQLKSRTLTLDYDHDVFRDPDTGQMHPVKKEKIGVGKIVEVKRDPKGVWIKAQLNSNLKMFPEIWKSIKEGFLKGFSIAFGGIKSKIKKIYGKSFRVLDRLNIINIAITGAPINTDATFTPTMKSFMDGLNNKKEEMFMEEKIKALEAELKSANEKNKALEATNVDLKAKVDEAAKNLDAANNDATKKETELKSIVETNATELKSFKEGVEKDMAELKAEVAKHEEFLSKPQLKALSEKAPADAPTDKPKSPLEMIR